jgi:hypothetical protein
MPESLSLSGSLVFFFNSFSRFSSISFKEISSLISFFFEIEDFPIKSSERMFSSDFPIFLKLL